MGYLNQKTTANDFAYGYMENSDGAIVRVPKTGMQGALGITALEELCEGVAEAANSANDAAAKAYDAAAEATAAAGACEGIVNGLNTMVDTVTKKTCVLSIEDGILTIREA